MYVLKNIVVRMKVDFAVLILTCCILSRIRKIHAEASENSPETEELQKAAEHDSSSDAPTPQKEEYTIFSAPNDERKLKNATKIGKFVYLPDNYDRLEEPPALSEENYYYFTNKDIMSRTTITGKNWFERFQLDVYSVIDVDENIGAVHLELSGTYLWVDARLVIDNSSAATALGDHGELNVDQFEVEIPVETLDKLWKPEFFIKHILSSTVPLTGRRDAARLRFFQTGMLKYTQRILVKIPCNFDFTFYPADVQTCHINAQSKGFPKNLLTFFGNLTDDNYEFNLIRNRKSDLERNELQVDLIVRRKLTYHLIQTYFLSIFFVIVTWLCLLISPDMVELRIAISLSTLLSLTTMFTSVKDETPKVSYLKAIDVWMVACIMFIFATLAGFTVTAWIKRSLKHLIENSEEHEIEFLVRSSSKSKSEETKTKLRKFYRTLAILVERCGVYIISGLFLGFNVIYWWSLLSRSDYFKIQTGDEDDGESTTEKQFFTPALATH